MSVQIFDLANANLCTAEGGLCGVALRLIENQLGKVADALTPDVPVVRAAVNAADLPDARLIAALIIGQEEIEKGVFLSHGAEKHVEGCVKGLFVIEEGAVSKGSPEKSEK